MTVHPGKRPAAGRGLGPCSFALVPCEAICASFQDETAHAKVRRPCTRIGSSHVRTIRPEGGIHAGFFTCK